MKKIVYSIAAAILCLTACQKQLSEVQPAAPAVPGTTVTVPFSVTIPGALDAPSRAGDIAETPVLENLYIAIFGEDGGMLQQFVPAKKLDDKSAIGYANRSKYTAELPLYDDECHLHFIGNFEGDIANLTFEYEKDFIEKLTTIIETENRTIDGVQYQGVKHAPGGYWQKVILEDGIKSQPGPNGTLVIADATKNQLNSIALVRNYAKITVEATADAYFTVESYALINIPYQGTLAPYHPTTGYNNHYMEIGKYCDGTYNLTDTQASNYHNFVTDLLESDYVGYMGTNDLIFTGLGSDIKNISDTDNGMYLYERTVPTRAGEQTGVIVKLKWKTSIPESDENHLLAGQEYWYKIEVLDSKGEYMPLCRNVQYKIILSKLTGAGAVDFAGAYNGPFFGNVSSSIETATLTTINDNIHQISVNRMDYFSVQGEDVVDLYFKFWLDRTGNPVTNPNNYYVAILKDSGYDQAVDSIGNIELINDSTDPNNGWMHVQVFLNPKDSEGKTLRGKVRIQGKDNNGMGSLFRDVVFTVMDIQDFTSETTVSSSGNNVTVNIGIPTDLPYTMFPLQIKIESRYNNLTTNNADLPVGYGTSAFTGKANTFYFIKTIQYKDYVNTSTGVYQYTTKFPCTFTNLDHTQELIINLTEVNGYFHPKTL